MSEIPTISITKEYDDDDDAVLDGDISDCSMKDALTDVEDLDNVTASVVKSDLKVKMTKKMKSSPATTDIEDYNDSSDQEEETSFVNDDTPLLLTEFLEQGITEIHDEAANKITTTTSHKQGTLFVSLLSNDDQGGITDCENYDSSGDELSVAGGDDDFSISAYLPEAENIEITDKNIQAKDDDNTDETESPLSVSEAGDFCDPNEISDAENIMLSDVEEDLVEKIHSVYNLANRKPLPQSVSTKFDIPQIQKDTLTDVEGFDIDSDAEIPNEVQLYVTVKAASKRPSLTDVEDLDIGDIAGLISEPQNVAASSIPAAVREITIVKADVAGQGITSTMPMMEAFASGIDNDIDNGMTDVEDISGDEDMFYSTSETIIEKMPDVYNTISKNKEVIKECPPDCSRNIIECEPTTDVEEIFMAGTVRRKKSTKTRNQNKNKKSSQQVKCQQEQKAHTDVEDFEVSDAESALEATNHHESLQIPTTSNSAGSKTSDIKTDVEYVSGDDEQSVSEGEDIINERVIRAINEASYYSTETTIESIYQSGSPYKRPETREIRRRAFENLMNPVSNQNLTDVEDINLPSDVEENTLNAFSYSRAETLSPNELQYALNDCSVSIVYDKCGSTFDIDKEKHHIKGLQDCPDAHTDVEYIEDENDPGKEKNSANGQ